LTRGVEADAFAKAAGASLLYKGDDFSKTDIESAV
jgi:uncharacterized protein with PIN domain